jgi:hypothetical protein
MVVRTPTPAKESTVATTSTKASGFWSPADISSSVKQAWERFDVAVGQVRHFTDSVTDATLASVKANQDATSQAVNKLAGLAGTRTFDVQGGLDAGFELTKALVESQLQLAEKLTGAARTTD